VAVVYLSVAQCPFGNQRQRRPFVQQLGFQAELEFGRTVYTTSTQTHASTLLRFATRFSIPAPELQHLPNPAITSLIWKHQIIGRLETNGLPDRAEKFR